MKILMGVRGELVLSVDGGLYWPGNNKTRVTSVDGIELDGPVYVHKYVCSLQLAVWILCMALVL